MRQAIAYALNRQQLVQTKGPGGAKVADEFMPDTVLGYAAGRAEVRATTRTRPSSCSRRPAPRV